MDDRQLDELLTDARRTYRVPPAAPLDALWHAIEGEAFAPAPRRTLDRRLFGAGLAAALLLGIIGGRLSMRPMGASTAAVAVSAGMPSTDPDDRAAEDLLGRTVVLLTAVRSGAPGGGDNARLAEQASQLLGTTRLLIDSPVGSDARLRTLLQDLELVLAQVARLEPARSTNALPIITAAVDQRDLVPRIRSAVVELSIGDY